MRVGVSGRGRGAELDHQVMSPSLAREECWVLSQGFKSMFYILGLGLRVGNQVACTNNMGLRVEG